MLAIFSKVLDTMFSSGFDGFLHYATCTSCRLSAEYVPTCWATAMLHIVDDSAAGIYNLVVSA